MKINEIVRLKISSDEFCKGMLNHDWIINSIIGDRVIIKSIQNPEFNGLIVYKDDVEIAGFDNKDKVIAEQQAKIDELQKKINNVNEVLSKANIKDDRFSLEFALNEIEELLK